METKNKTHLNSKEKLSTPNLYKTRNSNINTTKFELDFDINKPIHICDIKKVQNEDKMSFENLNSGNKNEGFGKKDKGVLWKFQILYKQNGSQKNDFKKKEWVNSLDFLDYEKKIEILKAYKTSISFLQNNDTMRNLSDKKLDLLKEYSYQNKIEIGFNFNYKEMQCKSHSHKKKKGCKSNLDSENVDPNLTDKKSLSCSTSKFSVAGTRILRSDNKLLSQKKLEDDELLRKRDMDMVADLLYINFHEYMINLKKTQNNYDRVGKGNLLELVDAPLQEQNNFINYFESNKS